MKGTLILALVAMLSMSSLQPAQPAQGYVAQAPPTTEPTTMTPQETDLFRWAVTQGGLTLALVLVLVFYRRDFFRKLEQSEETQRAALSAKQAEIELMREEKQNLKELVKENAASAQAVALAVAQNTHATDMLAASIKQLADRRQS